LPQNWKYATTVPAYKKGDRKCTSNYRPICLTCICCKLLEHIIHSSISTHWEANNVIRGEQQGFQQGKSCELQLIYTINDFANTLNKGEEIDALFLDFPKQSDIDMATHFNEYFSSIFTCEDTATASIPTVDSTSFPPLDDSIEITPEIVFSKLTALQSSKFPGPDGWPITIIKSVSEFISVPLCSYSV